jgi:hypothetical protein
MPPPNAFQVLVSASQAPSFEAHVRESRPKDSIVAPPEGSEYATAAASEAEDDDDKDDALDDEDDELEPFDAHLMDTYKGIDWARLKKYHQPLTSYKYKKSWVYRHGYCIALRSNPAKIYWVCHWCHCHKYHGGTFHTTGAISAALRHFELEKPGHNILGPGKQKKAQKLEGSVYEQMMGGKLKVSQAVANEIAGFNVHKFRQAAGGWLIDNNHPLSEFETPAFRELIHLANPLAKDALWVSHNSVSRYVVRWFDYRSAPMRS